MDSHDSFPFLKEIILFLALSGVLMPLLSREYLPLFSQQPQR